MIILGLNSAKDQILENQKSKRPKNGLSHQDSFMN